MACNYKFRDVILSWKFQRSSKSFPDYTTMRNEGMLTTHAARCVTIEYLGKALVRQRLEFMLAVVGEQIFEFEALKDGLKPEDKVDMPMLMKMINA